MATNPINAYSDCEPHSLAVKPLNSRALLRTKTVCGVFGNCSTMSIWRWVRDGFLPKPIVIAGRNYWFCEDIEVILDELRGKQKSSPDSDSIKSSTDTTGQLSNQEPITSPMGSDPALPEHRKNSRQILRFKKPRSGLHLTVQQKIKKPLG